MREVAIVGVGQTKFGPSEKSALELLSEASVDAINESNLKTKDIQALYMGNALGDWGDNQIAIPSFTAAALGIPNNVPASRYEGICASAGIAFKDAFMAVAGGFFDAVLTGGTERIMAMGVPRSTRTFAMGSDNYYECPVGITFPGVFAMLTYLYSKKYGIPLGKLKEQMYMVSIQSHAYGALNPKAHFQTSIASLMNRQVEKAKKGGKPAPTWSDEMEFLRDPVANRMIAQPLQLYDCCPFSDGAAAAVLVPADKAKKLTDKPVLVAGVGQGSAGPLITQKDFTIMKSRQMSAKRAYEMAGISPKDIDVCELHDCFSIASIVATEMLGFFELGEGSKAVERGETRIGGKVAINPSGGLKSKGHPIGATGVAQVYEIVKQLRGECGERQVEGAKIGMTDTLGGDLCVISNNILKRGW